MLLRDRMRLNWTRGWALATWPLLGAGGAAVVLWLFDVDVEQLPPRLRVLAFSSGGVLGFGVGLYAEFGQTTLARVLALAGLPLWLVAWCLVPTAFMGLRRDEVKDPAKGPQKR